MQVQSAIQRTLRPEMQRKSGCSGKLEISGSMLSLLVGLHLGNLKAVSETT